MAPPNSNPNEDPDNYPSRYQHAPPFSFHQPQSHGLHWVVGIMGAAFLVMIFALYLYVQNIKTDVHDQQKDSTFAMKEAKVATEDLARGLKGLDSDFADKIKTLKDQVANVASASNSSQVSVGTIITLQNQIQAFKTDLDGVKADVIRLQTTCKDIPGLTDSHNQVIQRLNALQRVYLNLQAQVREASLTQQPVQQSQQQQTTQYQPPTRQQPPIIMDNDGTYLDPNRTSDNTQRSGLFPQQ